VSLTLIDCNDNNDDINPGQEEFCNGLDDDCDTFIDEGLLNLTYYRDQDGDGFGNNSITQVACSQPAGFVLNNTDCNDNNASVNPNGTEACNGIDDDCDTVVDEGCGVINDEPFTGIIAIVAPYQVCTNQVGTLAGASASAQAQTICPTGEDVWYYFTASSTAISVLCNTTINDVVIELQTDAGALLASENATSGIGNERLNYFGLTPGETYFIAIRNFNSALGAGGSFQLCVQRVLSSTCDILSSPTNRINPCNSFKADYTAANQYIFHFDPTVNTTASTITYTLGMTSAPANPWISLASVPGIQYGEVYDVTIDAVYQLPFGNSQVEMLTVTGAQVCQLYIANQPSMSLRVADSCPNTKLRNAIVRAEPRICSNVVDYEWEFTQVLPTPGLAQTHLRGMNDRNLRLSSVPFLQNGGTYDVRIRPIFAGNVPGSWSTVSSCLRIAGAANIGVSKGEEEAVNLDRRNSIVEFNETFEFSVYPNPNSGDAVQLNINGINQENVTVQITDALGKRIYENKFYIESDQFYTVVEFNNSLTAGLYFIELVTEGRVREVKKLVVQK
jgi:hypothetical protein